MPINPRLLERLQTSLGLGRRRVYELIDRKVQETHLPRDLAAIALASERAINIARFATADQLAEIRQARVGSFPPTTVPAPPAAPPRRSRPATRKPVPRQRGNSVFVVHGRNLKARDDLFAFLRALALSPIEWVQAIKMTGEASPYVGKILDTAFAKAAAIVVLFTPDDEARLRRKFRKTREPLYETELTGQARPNVLFEAGRAFDPKSTVLVEVGDEQTRPFSDVAGRHVVHLTGSPASRRELATKLRNAGCDVNDTGSEWLTVCNFR
jgi:predicted nucleotide-binding protein